MPDDDPFADEGRLGPPLPPDDRLWRHPSELALPPVAPAARAGRPWTVALGAGLAGAAVALGAVALTGGLTRTVTERVVEPVPATSGPRLLEAPGSDGRVPGAAASARPSVVRLDIGGVTASGVVFRDDGVVVTTAQAVGDAGAVQIVLADGTAVPGRVAGVDRPTGIAVVVAEGADEVAWVPAEFADGGSPAPGELAIAVGGEPSLTAGAVTAVGRTAVIGGKALYDLIETDAPVMPEASGGALCDGAGAVMGIAAAPDAPPGGRATNGYAIPAALARTVAEELLTAGWVRHAWLGVRGADRIGGGVVVVEVDADGPAAGAGIVAGDVLVAAGGEPLRTMSDLVLALRRRQPGEVVVLDVERSGRVEQVEVALAERPAG